MVIALVLALAQEDITILFGDPVRSVYETYVRRCERAREVVDSDPAQAVGLLDEVLEMESKLPVAKRPPSFERRIRIQDRPNDFSTKPADFFPHQYRARARMNLARKAAAAEARKLLADAVADLEASVERKNRTSEALLKEARAALWSNLQGALAFETWSPADADAGARAQALLARQEIPREIADWLGAEVGKAVAKAAELKRDREQPEARQQAPRVARWCRTIAAAVKDLKAFDGLAARVKAAAGEAEGAADFKAFRLKIAVSPYAEGVKLKREGVEVALSRDYTPLVVAASLDVGRYEVTLRHPKWGERRHAIASEEIEEGKTHVLTGDMETGKFRLTRLP